MTFSEQRHHVRCGILPPYLLEAVAASAGSSGAAARATLVRDESLRTARVRQPAAAPAADPAAGGLSRTISDAGGQETLPGETVRTEGAPATDDVAVTEAYDGLGATWQLLHDAFQRDSLDGKGLPLLASVHYGVDYDNAFWDGTQMVFGDGDGELFNRFTASVDVIGHELTHGLTEHTAGLVYQGQPGALNESISDVFAACVRQHLLDQSAEEADWLIGADLLAEGVQGRALRDMARPGTAYDDPRLGRDPQPAHMDDYVETSDDNGGVHLNSGIPNRAFVLAATGIGGRSWEGAGQVWYSVLTGEISADCDFATFAGLTVTAAEGLFGAGSPGADAVRQAWVTVGVLGEQTVPAGDVTEPATTPDPGAVPHQDTVLEVARHGGFAGRRQYREVRLGDLPEPDSATWSGLLSGQTLDQLTSAVQTRPVPDAFNYEVRCPECAVDVSLPEPALPADLRDLLQRTLEG